MSLEIKCENCFAVFKVPHKVPIATCPYCSYTFIADKEITEIYYFKVNFDSSSSFEKLIKFILRNFGVPSDFKAETTIKNYTLHYFPFHIVKAEGKGKCLYKEGIFFKKRYKGDFIEVLDFYIPASIISSNLEVITNYKFGLRGREYFKPRMTKIGKYYIVQFDKDYAINIAKSKVFESLKRDISSACEGEEIIEYIKTEYLGITYYPFWEIIYEYKGEELRGIVDATNGRVLYSEYIIDPKARKFASLAVISVIIPATIVGSFFGTIGFFIGIVSALISSIPALPKIFLRKIKAKEIFTEFELKSLMKLTEISTKTLLFKPKKFKYLIFSYI